MKLIFCFIALWTAGLQLVTAQQMDVMLNLQPEKAPNDWYLLDAKENGWKGISAEKAYKELLAGKTAKEVVVAVIDGGIDVEHEDLTENIWKNPREVAGNGKDDDGNGYVDDIYGWNFIGGKDGNVQYESMELTRELSRLEPKYKDVDPAKLKGVAAKEYAYYESLKQTYDEKMNDAQQNFAIVNQLVSLYGFSIELLTPLLQGKPLTLENISAIEPSNDTIKAAKEFMQLAFLNEWDEAYLKEAYEHYATQVEYALNPEFDGREVVGDNPDDLENRIYGNKDVEGPDAEHGTHVAGIIGARRGNDKGIQGIAPNVKIMAIRAVPDGDERDKDVANAIFYAVNNGAQIINMSFGKDYSPNKAYVDKAVKYARKKGVLLVHAAGNDGENIDETENYPTKSYKVSHGKKQADNWIEVGASSWIDSSFVADFSNFGKELVDIFAPGKDIYSTIPDDQYKENDGTSMAAPVVTGVAALLKGYYPELDYKTLKRIIVESAVKFPGATVIQPGTGERIPFNTLSKYGGIVNVYEAVQMAEKLKK